MVSPELNDSGPGGRRDMGNESVNSQKAKTHSIRLTFLTASWKLESASSWHLAYTWTFKHFFLTVYSPILACSHFTFSRPAVIYSQCKFFKNNFYLSAPNPFCNRAPINPKTVDVSSPSSSAANGSNCMSQDNKSFPDNSRPGRFCLTPLCSHLFFNSFITKLISQK